MIYGGYEFFKIGLDPNFFLYTYVPLIGGFVSLISLSLWLRLASKPYQEGWLRFLSAHSGWIMLFYLLYIVIFLGAYSIYQGIFGGDSRWSILIGIVWMALGHRSASEFARLQEVPKSIRLGTFHDPFIKQFNSSDINKNCSPEVRSRPTIKSLILDNSLRVRIDCTSPKTDR